MASLLASFDGQANCFVETGHQKAMLLDFNYDIEPLEGSFPLPHAGPFSLLEESYMNHISKIAFRWVCWNLLLPGRLPNVPLLPSHMSFPGNDVTTAPQIPVPAKCACATWSKPSSASAGCARGWGPSSRT